MNKKLIVFANNYWCSPYQVGSHFFARQFVKDGWDVLYVSDPINVVHRTLKAGDADVIARRKESPGLLVEPGITAYVPEVLLSPMRKPFLDSKWLINNWWRLGFPSVLKKIGEMGFSKPDLIFFNSLQFNWILPHMQGVPNVFRLADWNPAMNGLPRSAIDSQDELINQCNLVFASSQAVIKDHLAGAIDREVFYLPNGVDLNSMRLGNNKPVEYLEFSNKNKIAVYVGAIDERFDDSLLFKAARNAPDVMFFIVGKVSKGIDFSMMPSNVKFIGPKPFSDVSSYLEHADVALMLQSRSYAATEYFNPLKLYQYMYFNLPVVSTSWKELLLLNPPIRIANSDSEFVNLLAASINSIAVDFDAYRRFVEKNTWANSYSILKGHVESICHD